MTAAWPVSLSTKFMAISGLTEDAFTDPAIRTPMDLGPPKIRSRYTSIPTKIEGVVGMLTSTDVDNLIAFWQNTCAEGSLNFTWVHPRTGATTTYMWLKFPAITNLGDAGTIFQAAVSLLKIS